MAPRPGGVKQAMVVSLTMDSQANAFKGNFRPNHWRHFQAGLQQSGISPGQENHDGRAGRVSDPDWRAGRVSERRKAGVFAGLRSLTLPARHSFYHGVDAADNGPENPCLNGPRPAPP